MPESSWLLTLYDLASKDDEAAADMVFDEIDQLLSSQDFSRCDDILRFVEVDRLNANLLVTFLSATLTAKGLLPSRAEFVRRIEKRLNDVEPFRVEALLKNLT